MSGDNNVIIMLCSMLIRKREIIISFFFSFKSDFLSFIQWDRYMEKKRIKIIMRIKWGLNGVYLTSSIILNFLMVLTEK